MASRESGVEGKEVERRRRKMERGRASREGKAEVEGGNVYQALRFPYVLLDLLDTFSSVGRGAVGDESIETRGIRIQLTQSSYSLERGCQDAEEERREGETEGGSGGEVCKLIKFS